jgi:hypothetical protein
MIAATDVAKVSAAVAVGPARNVERWRVTAAVPLAMTVIEQNPGRFEGGNSPA